MHWLFETLFSTFGPFLIPAALFALGVVGYLVILVLGRVRRDR